MNFFKSLGAIGFGLVIIAMIALLIMWPLAIVFALNTLFPLLSIPYSFLTWLAVVVLNISTFGGLNVNLQGIKNSLVK